VKTTLELPGDLLRRTKAEAAVRGSSMKDLIVEALEDKLKARGASKGGWRRVFGRGRGAATRDLERRLAEFERVEHAEWK